MGIGHSRVSFRTACVFLIAVDFPHSYLRHRSVGIIRLVSSFERSAVDSPVSVAKRERGRHFAGGVRVALSRWNMHQEIGLLDKPKSLNAMHSRLHDFETVNEKPKLLTLIKFKKRPVIGIIEYDSCSENDQE
jgi:hypothetical protein